jgi:poly(A) polymerase
VDTATLEAVRRSAPFIARISAERIRDELNKVLTRGGARRGFELMRQTGILDVVLPEVAAMVGVEQPPQFHPEGDVWEHTMIMLDRMAPAPDHRLAWGVLLHDVGKPPTREETTEGVHFYGHCRVGGDMAEEIMRRLKFSNADIDSVRALVDSHMRFMPVQEMRPNKLKRFLRMPAFDQHLELHRLDCVSSHGMLDNYEFCKRQLAALAEDDLRPPPLVAGNDLIAMGFVPGPLFGEILTAIEDAQLDGAIDGKEGAAKMIIERWGDRRDGR